MYFDDDLNFEGSGKIRSAKRPMSFRLKDKFIKLKESLQKRYYYFMIGIVIATVIIIIVNVIRKVSNKLSKNPQDTSCMNFKNTTINILMTIALLINFYLVIPKQLYKYKVYQDKLEKLEEAKSKHKIINE